MKKSDYFTDTRKTNSIVQRKAEDMYILKKGVARASIPGFTAVLFKPRLAGYTFSTGTSSQKVNPIKIFDQTDSTTHPPTLRTINTCFAETILSAIRSHNPFTSLGPQLKKQGNGCEGT